MPAKSRNQAIAAAIAEHHPEKLYKRNKSLLGMSHDELHKYASTPRKKLPKKAKKNTLLTGK